MHLHHTSCPLTYSSMSLPTLGNSFKIKETHLGIFRLNKYLFAIAFAIPRFVCECKLSLCFLIILIPSGELSFFTESHYGQHGGGTGLYTLSWNVHSPRERSVPYKLPNRETKRELEEVNIYVAGILRWLEKLLLQTFRNGFYHVLHNSKPAKKIDKSKIFDSELWQDWDITTSKMQPSISKG